MLWTVQLSPMWLIVLDMPYSHASFGPPSTDALEQGALSDCRGFPPALFSMDGPDRRTAQLFPASGLTSGISLYAS